MRKLHLFISLLIALSVVVVMSPGPAAAQEPSEEPVKIMLVQHSNCAWDAFWCVVEQGIDDAAKMFNAEVTLLSPDKYSPEQTTADIDKALAANPDALSVTITDPVEMQEPLMRAINSGIPVYAYNGGDDRPAEEQIPYKSFFGSDNRLAALEGSRRLLRDHPDAKRGVCVNHCTGIGHCEQRCLGLAEAMEEKGLESQVLAIPVADPAQSTTIISDFYAANPDVDLWLTLGPNSANPFYAFVEREGLKPGDIYHGTFDMTSEILQNIQDGMTDFAIDQQPYMEGFYAVMWPALTVRYGLDPVINPMLTGPAFVDASNVDKVIALAGKYR